jgi:hypothetical protein
LRSFRPTGGPVEQHTIKIRSSGMEYPTTPDGRYFVVKGRLWRCTNPHLPENTRKKLVSELMQARRLKGIAMRANDVSGIESARQAVDAAKSELGERGDVWWTDGAPDWNEQMAKDTPYAEWFRTIAGE